MKKPRRNHSPSFKARIALDAIRGIKTSTEIDAENGLHPAQVTAWKTELSQNASELFLRNPHAKMNLALFRLRKFREIRLKNRLRGCVYEQT